MRFFYDTEFLERGPAYPLQLISIGVVAEDGREYFAANADFDPATATPWLREHVLPQLPPRGEVCWKRPGAIARELVDFVGSEPPEWWADYGAYDHVVLCQLFGDMDGLPPGWPMFSHDIQQWRCTLGSPKLPSQPGGGHDALADARWILNRWLFLRDHARSIVESMVTAAGPDLPPGAQEKLRGELVRALVPQPLILEASRPRSGG